MIEVPISPMKMSYESVSAWLDKYTEGSYRKNVWSVEFEFESDAVLFRLKWK